MVNSEELISTPAAGSILGVSRQHAYRLCINGGLPSQLVAGNIVVRRSDAIRLKQEREMRVAGRGKS